MRRAVVVGLVVGALVLVGLSGTAAADPGTHEVTVTDGTGAVNSTYYYDASTGMINISRDSGWTNVTLSDSDHSALAIQWALDNSTTANDTVRVGSGTYNGTVNVFDDSRTIEAPNGSSVTTLTERSGQSTKGIYMNASDVTITNITVSGFSDDGIYVLGDSENVTVNESEIRNNGAIGLELDAPIGDHSNVFSNNTLSGNALSAIYVDRVHGNTFENNTITASNTAGIELFSSFDNTVENNRIHNNTDPGFVGIDLTGNADGNYVGNTTVEDNAGTGILVGGANDDVDNAEIVGSTVRNSSGTGIEVYGNSTSMTATNASANGNYGVRVVSGWELSFQDTTAMNNGDTGLRLNDTTNVTVDGVSSESNGNRGVYLSGHSQNVTVDGGTVADNTGIGVNIDSPLGYHDFAVRNLTISGNGQRAIYVDRVHGTVFENNTITASNTAGIELFSSFDNTVENNRIHNNTDPGFVGIDLTGNADGNYVGNTTVEDNAGTGIVVGGPNDDVENADLVGTTVTNASGTGIYVFANTTTIRDTIATDTGSVSIDVDGGDDQSLSNVTASNASNYGMTINQSANVSMTDVTANDNGADGIRANATASDVSIVGGEVSRNGGEGVRLRSGGTDVPVQDLHMEANTGIGVRINGPSSAMVTGNTIIDGGSAGVRVDHADGSVISNNTVRGHTASMVAGIDLNLGTSDARLINNTVEDVDGFGISIGNANTGTTDNTTIEEALIENTTNSGIYFSSDNSSVNDTAVNDTGGEGIDLDRGDNLDLNNVTASNATNRGIVVNQSATVSLTEVTANDNGGIGIRANATASDVSVVGGEVSRNGQDGVVLESSGTEVPVRDLHMEANTGIGVWINGPSSAMVTGNTILDGGSAGVRVDHATGSEISNNTVRGHTASMVAGIDVNLGTDDARVVDNTVEDVDGFGISIGNANTGTTDNTTIEEAQIDNTTDSGIYFSSNDSSITDTAVNDTGGDGIDLDRGDDLTLHNVSVSHSAAVGLMVNQSTNVSATALTATDADGIGIRINATATNVSVADSVASNNNGSDLHAGASADPLTATNLSVGDVTYDLHAASNVTVEEFDGSPPAGPSGVLSVGDASNISSLGGGYANATWRYTATAADGIDEATIDLYHYNATHGNWSVLDGSVDTGANGVSANVTSFSTFAIFGEEADDDSSNGLSFGDGVDIGDEETDTPTAGPVQTPIEVTTTTPTTTEPTTEETTERQTTTEQTPTPTTSGGPGFGGAVAVLAMLAAAALLARRR